MVKNMKHAKAFTLIELIVVIGIIAFFAGMGTLSFSNFNQENKLKQEKERVVDELDLARKKALAPDQINCAAGLEEAYAFISDANSYSVQECCRDAVNTLSSCVTTTSYVFPANISRIVGTPQIIFYSVNKGSNGTSTPIRIKNTSIDKCLDVSVSTTGAITVSDISPC